MGNGTRQNDRLADTLRSGGVLPDEFGLADRIRLSLAQAGDLRFGARPDGGFWDAALRRDDTVLLAELASFPLERLEAGFVAALERESEAALWARLWGVVRSYDGWCWRLGGQQMSVARIGSALRHTGGTDTTETERIDDALGEALLAQLEQGLGEMLGSGIAMFGHGGGRLHPAWVDHAAEAGTPLAAVLPADDRTGRRQWLRRSWLALQLSIAKLRPLARAQFEQSLATGRHEPSMGLLLTALQLFQYTRAPLNRFPDRLIDFYYGDVLRLTPRPAVPESVHLLLARAARYAGTVEIPAGMRFAGGKDSQGRALEFAADAAMSITDTRVATLCSLRMERDSTISPQREFDYPTRIKMEYLPLLAPANAYGERARWWPLLGGAVRNTASQAQDARLGFALASPLLRLQEGQRELRVRLQLSHPAADNAALLRALRVPRDKRDADWLTAVYQAYAEFEAQHFPGRPRPPAPLKTLDAAALARDAWARSNCFEHGDAHLSFLLAVCLACDDADRFAERLGRLFAAWLVAGDEDLRTVDLMALRAHAAKLAPERKDRRVEIDDPLILIHPPRHGGHTAEVTELPDRTLIFERVFAGIWQAELSVPTGWLTFHGVFTRRRPRADDVAQNGGMPMGGAVELVLQLGPDTPPIVPCQPAIHGEQWPEQAAIQFVLRTHSRMYAYGMLQQYTLQDIRLSVSVHALRSVVLYNQLGRLDPSKPFLPFGPTPAVGSYLAFSSPELACKPLQALHLDLTWSGLPLLTGGFPEHYERYPGDWPASGFRCAARVLADGNWRHGDEASMPLFTTINGRERLASAHRLVFPAATLRRLHRAAAPRPAAEPFAYGLGTRSGFFRLELAEPPGAFGHALYPTLLADALTQNARRKHGGPVPRGPYTPVLESISLGYQSSQEIALTSASSEVAPGLLQGAYHVLPFGISPILRSGTQARDKAPSLLPRYPSDGNLYIGLDGSDPQGGLNLFFHLRKEVASGRWSDETPVFDWATWHEGGWQPLPAHAVVSDGTQGMLRSGIVRLNLPGGMAPLCMPGATPQYWLRLSADWGFLRMAGLYGVHCHAVRATRVAPDGADGVLEQVELPPGSIDRAARSLAGLGTVLQVGASDGWRAADPPEALRMRAAERLRHKARAVTRWDYERLLLDAFPVVWKAKCFPHHEPASLDARDTAAGPRHRHLANRPGHVLVVVVPYPHPGDLFSSTEASRLDAATLDAMERHLRACAPPGATICVRNAAYERAQVRCSVRLARDRHPGAALRQLNQAIIEHLSPWHANGLGAEFDWSVRAEDMEALLRAQPGVEEVGRVSMLHIVRNDRQFNALHDTATHVIHGEARTLRPAQPWSLLLPTRTHLIELRDQLGPLVPQPTGIRRLAVGGTFIVGRSAQATASGRAAGADGEGSAP
ncbi:baseplate J/gp47 family protein [Cupriavidus pampae]|uniref:Baseplate protein J-like domain-containing protein n=1 Tax=Cupriavidus pampae TaxID=659251 RepID=A0ABM8Y158_9BURK|nr:hypothetical protein [Cupriavidus pampae]CAG9186471.1 hypothetical protein LMG32289_06450 [Cupriavidus pampae]